MSTIRAKFRPSRAVLASVKSEAGKPAPARPRRVRADRLARQLALAHWIERAIEAGAVASYSDVAQRLGLTQARVSQIVALALLPRAVQEQVLMGESGIGIRAAMRAARHAVWQDQMAAPGS